MASPKEPTSSSASFYDLSDDEEGEYNTIMHSSSGKGVKLLFSKSKVEFPCRTVDDKKANRLMTGLYSSNAIIQR